MRNYKLPLSVIIPCADDVRIKNCIDSIDEDVEIVVVLNGPTSEVVKILEDYSVKKVEIKERNLSKALNIGIKSAVNQCVILIDSDCWFEHGAIRGLFNVLQSNYIAKGNVVFQHNDFFSEVIAKTREYSYYNPPKPYNPFLGIRKDVKEHIGGYYFDETIHWTEDADLSIRLKKATIKVSYVFSAKAFHPPLSLKHDLRSAFRYGIGKRIRVEKRNSNSVGTHFSKIPDVMSKKGFCTGLYYVIWNCSYFLGYMYQMVANPYKLTLSK